MSEMKNKAIGREPSAVTQDVPALREETKNIYKSLVIISKRANYLSKEFKRELTAKLEEFAIAPDSLDEMTENKEQIEISKFYERMPNPAIIATQEYLEGELVYRHRDEDEEEEDEVLD